MEQHEPKPGLKEYGNWIKGPIENEGGEFRRVLETFYGKEIVDSRQEEFYDLIRKNYEASKIVELPNDIWSKLENTDSRDIAIGDFEKIEGLIEQQRDWKIIKEGFDNQKDIEVPIIARLPDGSYHLVSGNTRLCITKASGFKAKVIVLEFPDFK